MEHMKLICSLEYELFFISISSIRIFSVKWDILEKPETPISALKADGLIEAGDQNQIQHFPVAHVAPPMAQPTQQQPVTPQQQQFPIQIQNSTETVIMEVMPG